MASTTIAVGLDVAVPAGQLGILRRNSAGRRIEDGECSESDLGCERNSDVFKGYFGRTK